MLLNRLTYRSNKSGCKAFCIFNYKPCQKCAKAPGWVGMETLLLPGTWRVTRDYGMNLMLSVTVGPNKIWQQIVVFIHRPTLKLTFSCLLRTDEHQIVWNMAEPAALTRMFEKVYFIFTCGKRNQWNMNYTYYFGRSDRNVSKVTSFNVQALIVEKVDKCRSSG